MRVIADRELCQGHQLCQGEAPDVFGFDEDTDNVLLLAERPDETRRGDVTQAVRYCPAFALTIQEED